MGTVMLATDGSDYARWAAERAVDLAEERDADLHVVSVVDRRKFGEPALSSDELAAILAEDRGYYSVNEVTRMAEGRGVAVTGDVRRGVPVETILEHADTADANYIVVGEHGEHDSHLGGVGRRVAERADCEVVVVSPGTRPRYGRP